MDEHEKSICERFLDAALAPRFNGMRMTSPEVRKVLMHFDGVIVKCGLVREIAAKHIAAGVHMVTLKGDDDAETNG